ncbi:MAG TPA: hypothetical protein VK596_11230 [Edaphobacter sp.]|nr:hypothetical protein [Edaphobacter sp.]
MKTFPLLLSLLAFIGFAASLGAQVPASPLTLSQRDAGIRELHKDFVVNHTQKEQLPAESCFRRYYREVCSAA